MGIFEDAREAAALPGGPRPGALSRVCDVAQLVAVDGDTQRATVSLRGSEAFDLPYLPGVYTGYTTCLVLCDPLDGGRAVYVLGPVGVQVDPPTPPAPPPPPSSGGTVSATAVILPIWSGTWRATRGAWDRWNTDRHGGRSTLYQGNAYGSGPVTGLAVYGDQVVGLGATAITDMQVAVTIATGSGTPVIQASGAGTPPSGAPGFGGDTVSGIGWVPLSAAMRTAFLAGAAKGLGLVGGDYLAVYGTGRADGMALRVTYERPA